MRPSLVRLLSVLLVLLLATSTFSFLINVVEAQERKVIIVSITDAPDPVHAGDRWTIDIRVRNVDAGALWADVWVSLTFRPAGVTVNLPKVRIPKRSEHTFTHSLTAGIPGSNLRPGDNTIEVRVWWDDRGNQRLQDVRSESAKVVPVKLIGWRIEPRSVRPGDSFKAYYTIRNPTGQSWDVGLGLSIRSPAGRVINDPARDVIRRVDPGERVYDRDFVVPSDAEDGSYDVAFGLWSGKPGASEWWGGSGWIRGMLTIDRTPPPPPSLKSPADGATVPTLTPTLEWHSVTDPSTPVSYQVWVDDESGFASPRIWESDWTTSTSVTVPSGRLVTGKTYYWRVRARDGVGNVGGWSSSRRIIVSPPPPPFDFSISVSPSSQTVEAGRSTSYTVRVSLISGTTQPVSLRLEGLPREVGVEAISPTSGSPTFTATLEIRTFEAAPAGTYSLKVIGTGGGVTRESTPFTLTLVAKRALGSLVVNVYNIERRPLPSAGGVIEVHLWYGDYKEYIGKKEATFSGGEPYKSVSFTNLKPGSYTIEVYQTPNIGLRLREFWGANGGIKVEAGKTTTFEFVRHTQVSWGIDPAGKPLPLQPITPKPTVKNYESYDIEVKVGLIIDRDKSLPWDYGQTSRAYIVRGNGGTYTFTLPTFTPPSPGRYYYYIIVYGRYGVAELVTDQSPWIDWIEFYTTPKGNLQVDVHNLPGYKLPRAGGTITVALWYGNYERWVGSKSTTFKGGEDYVSITFTDLDPGDYVYEVRQMPNIGLRLTEFWGSGFARVEAGGTTVSKFYRHTQATWDVKPRCVVIKLGDTINPTVDVKNFEKGSVDVKVRLIYDRDQRSPYDYDRTSDVLPVLGEGKTRTFNLPSFTPPAAGTYYFYVIILGKYKDWEVTDQWVWEKAFEVIPPIIKLDVLNARTDKSHIKPGEEITFYFDVINNGNVEVTFYPVLKNKAPDGREFTRGPTGIIPDKATLKPGERRSFTSKAIPEATSHWYREFGAGEYKWGVILIDESGTKKYTDTCYIKSFTIIDVTPPPPPSLKLPADGATVPTLTPTLEWHPVTDPSTPVSYEVWVDDEPDFRWWRIVESGWITSTSFTIPSGKLSEGKTYYWRVRAKDNAGNVGEWSLPHKFTVTRTETILTLDLPPKVEGQDVVFTGRLIRSDTGEGLSNMEIKIIDRACWGALLPKEEILAVGKTDESGRFLIRWRARRVGLEKDVEIYSKFEGTELFKPARFPKTDYYYIQVDPLKPFDIQIGTLLSQVVIRPDDVKFFIIVGSNYNFDPPIDAPVVTLSIKGLPLGTYELKPSSGKLLSMIYPAIFSFFVSELNINTSRISIGSHSFELIAEGGGISRSIKMRLEVVDNSPYGARRVLYDLFSKQIAPEFWVHLAELEVARIVESPLDYMLKNLKRLLEISPGLLGPLKFLIDWVADQFENVIFPLIRALKKLSIGLVLIESADIPPKTDIQSIYDRLQQIPSLIKEGRYSEAKSRLSSVLNDTKIWREKVAMNIRESEPKRAVLTILGNLEEFINKELNIIAIPTMEVQPRTWSDTVEAGKSKSQVFTVSASGGTVKGVTIARVSGPAWITVSPASLGDIPAGTSKTFTITASPPAGTSGSFSYTVRVSCTEGEPRSIDVFGTITVTLPTPPFDFSISVSPSSQTVVAGRSTSYTVNVTLISGVPQPVSLTLSGLPADATYSFTPPSGKPTFESILIITTKPTTPIGDYTLEITCSGGGVTKSITFGLKVTPPRLPDLALEPILRPAIPGPSHVEVNKGDADAGLHTDRFTIIEIDGKRVDGPSYENRHKLPAGASSPIPMPPPELLSRLLLWGVREVKVRVVLDIHNEVEEKDETNNVGIVTIVLPRPTMDVQPRTWSDTIEAGKSKSQTFIVSAIGGTVKGVTVTRISGPAWITVRPTSLGDIPAGTSKTFTITASPPAGTSGSFSYRVRVSCTEGEPRSIEIFGTITVTRLLRITQGISLPTLRLGGPAGIPVTNPELKVSPEGTVSGSITFTVENIQPGGWITPLIWVTSWERGTVADGKVRVITGHVPAGTKALRHQTIG